MTFDTVAQVPPSTILHADVCVVGTGAAGIALALQFDGSGLDVLVLEAGGWQQDRAVEAQTFAVGQLGVPPRNPIPDRGRWFGGSTNLWFGRIAEPMPIDFEERAWVPHSGWPITLAELKPHFKTAARILDVPQFEQIDIERWERNATIDTFARGANTDLGVFLWADGMYMGTRHRAAIEASRNVRVLLDATATELIEHPSGGAIDSLAVSGPAGERFTVQAGTFVLAAGGIENPRLLLASTGRSPEGVGNEYDQVGRYYMDHPRGEGLASVDLRGLSDAQIERVSLLGEKSKTRYGHTQLRVTFSEELQRGEELLNHALHAHLTFGVPARGHEAVRRLSQRVRQAPLDPGPSVAADLTSALAVSPQLARYATSRLLGRARPSALVVIDQMEQEPDPLSRLTVDRSRHDAFGLPRVEVDWRIGESTYRSQRRMHEVVRDVLQEFGIGTFRSQVLERDPGDVDLWDMKHPSGTTRMSGSPHDGVVGTDCRVHGIQNLYVAGTSVFPTVGHFNPTLTIVALAVRLADGIKRVGASRGTSTLQGTQGLASG